MAAPTLMSDTALAGLLKNVYTNHRVKVQNLTCQLLAQLERAKSGGANRMRWGGNGVFWDIVSGRPSGGTFSPGGYFPADTTAAEKQASSGVARGYITRQLDNLAVVGTQSAASAFESVVRKTMEELKDASRLLLQGAIHGAGDGVIGLVASVTSPVQFTVTSPYGVSGAGEGGLLINPGDYIAIRSPDGATLRGKGQVTSVANSGTTATVVTPSIAGVTAADVIVRATASDDSYSATLGVNVFNGLIGITNRGGSYGVLHGLSAATTPIWDAVRLVAGTDVGDASQPTEGDIWVLIQKVAGKSGKDAFMSPDEFFLLTTPGIAKKLGDSLVGQRRFDASDFAKKVKGGFKAVEICGLPCLTDYYVPAGTIYLIHKPSMAWVDAADWGWVDEESPMRWMSGRDAREYTYRIYANLVALARNSHGSITGYTDTTFFSHVS